MDQVSLLSIDFDYDNDIGGGLRTINHTSSISKTDKSKIKDLLIENIIKLGSENSEISQYLIPNKDPRTLEIEQRSLWSKILSASSLIATQGRIGPMTNMLISKENYDIHGIDVLCQELHFQVLFDDSVDDCIIVYRVNGSSHPGLVMMRNEDKYEFIPIGLRPSNQFIKIKL